MILYLYVYLWIVTSYFIFGSRHVIVYIYHSVKPGVSLSLLLSRGKWLFMFTFELKCYRLCLPLGRQYRLPLADSRAAPPSPTYRTQKDLAPQSPPVSYTKTNHHQSTNTEKNITIYMVVVKYIFWCKSVWMMYSSIDESIDWSILWTLSIKPIKTYRKRCQCCR